MLALLKKDLLLNSWLSYSSFCLFILGAYITIPSPYIIFFISFFAFCYSVFYSDDRYRVNQFIISLPIKRKTMIQSRYLYCMLIVVLVIVLQKVYMLLLSPILPEHYYIYGWKDMVLVLCIGFLAIAIAIPILHMVRAIYAFVIFMVLNSIFTFFLLNELVAILHIKDVIVFNKLNAGFVLLLEKYIPYHPYIVLPIVTGIMLYFSMLLTVKIFNTKNC